MNFIADLFIDAIFYGSMYFLWAVIFSYVDVLGDFDQQAVIIFLIIMYLTDTVFVFFFGANTFTLNTMVVKGDLDLVLIKPVNPQFFMSFRYVANYSLVSFIILTTSSFSNAAMTKKECMASVKGSHEKMKCFIYLICLFKFIYTFS